ncbi:hypothetical protein [Limosilactobacillus fermentum]|uniref:hypothetical protein n=1 Tax=Limosilactobacillus fermentum TaxID=1613 RepID=UPI0012FFD8B3|nr:hypothetical protein [Limosilactobacillus fermentum]
MIFGSQATDFSQWWLTHQVDERLVEPERVPEELTDDRLGMGLYHHRFNRPRLD